MRTEIGEEHLAIELEGWLDAEQVRRVAEFLEGKPPVRRLVLDFKKVKAIDAEAMVALAAEVHRRPGTRLELTGMTLLLAERLLELEQGARAASAP